MRSGLIDEKLYQEKLANEKMNLYQVLDDVLVWKIIGANNRHGEHSIRTYPLEDVDVKMRRIFFTHNKEEDNNDEDD